MAKNLTITAYPYAVQYGVLIGAPDDVDEDYIREHWNSIKWGKPELDYFGTDFEFEEESV